MQAVALFDMHLQGFDFGQLSARAEHQIVEERRLACAQSVFRNGDCGQKPGVHTRSARLAG